MHLVALVIIAAEYMLSGACFVAYAFTGGSSLLFMAVLLLAVAIFNTIMFIASIRQECLVTENRGSH